MGAAAPALRTRGGTAAPIGDEVEHLLQLLGAGALVSDEGDERPVEMVEKFGDDLVLFLETIEDRTDAVDTTQVRKDADVLQGVVAGDDPAVLLAVGAEGPVVLPQRHPVDRRPRRADRSTAVRDLLDDVAKAGELGAERVVDVDEVLWRCLLDGGVGERRRRREGWAGALVPGRLVAEPGTVVHCWMNIES
jgi:hypothetical protein